jgi:tetratricopeptide repeat protein
MLGDDHSNTLASINNLAETYRTSATSRAPTSYSNRSLAAHRRTLGPRHPDTLRSMNRLAQICRELHGL